MKERLNKTAEFFTPHALTFEMLEKVQQFAPELLSNPNKRTLEMCCGNGNIVLSILRAKHALGMTKKEAILSTFAVDLMHDNVRDLTSRVVYWLHFDLDLPVESNDSSIRETLKNSQKYYNYNDHHVYVFPKTDKPWQFDYAIKRTESLDFSNNFVVADVNTYDLSFDGSEP